VKGSWIIELNKNDALQAVVTIFHYAPDYICIPMVLGIISDEEFLHCKQWLGKDVILAIKSVFCRQGL